MTAVEPPASPGSKEMPSGTVVPPDRILSAFTNGSQESLPNLCQELLSHQQSSWSLLKEGYSAFNEVRRRTVMCDGYSVDIQFNPARLTSSVAKTDPVSIKERECFLCSENLPPGQKGVLYRDEFLILCNPAPILDRHLTISHRTHIPQAIEGFVSTFLGLAMEMSPAFTVFYNGPKCGASAPDHMHFQASPAGAIPVEKEAADPPRREWRKSMGSVSIYTLKNFGRETILVEGNRKTGVEDALSRLFMSLSRILGAAGEPMVNILCSYRVDTWTLVLFPRKKHRPDFYFHPGDERVLISPAAIDVGGLVVTPLERDFNRVDATMIQKMFDQVLLDRTTVDSVLSAM